MDNQQRSKIEHLATHCTAELNNLRHAANAAYLLLDPSTEHDEQVKAQLFSLKNYLLVAENDALDLKALLP